MLEGIDSDNVDDECFLDVDYDKNRLIPWFIIATYAKSEKKNALITDHMMSRLNKKLVDNWDILCHSLKQCLYITREGDCIVQQYPKHIEFYYKQMREIYVGKNSKGNDR